MAIIGCSFFSSAERMRAPSVTENMFTSELSCPSKLCGRWAVRVQPVFPVCGIEFHELFGNKPICKLHDIIHVDCQYMFEAVYITFENGYFFAMTNYRYMINEKRLLEPCFITPEWRSVGDPVTFNGLSTMKEVSYYIEILNKKIMEVRSESRVKQEASLTEAAKALPAQETEWQMIKRPCGIKIIDLVKENPIKGF